jgi:hypothetical protein
LLEFVATDTNGFGMQAGDFGDLLDAAVASLPGLPPGDPTSLLLVETAKNQIEKVMVLIRGTIASATCRTSALVNRTIRCHYRHPSLELPIKYQILSNHGIEIGQVLRWVPPNANNSLGG